MIVIAGGTGNLGTALIPLLTARGHPVRVITRDPARTRPRTAAGIELVTADVRDPDAVARAVAGARTVISAITGFGGPGAAGAPAIDRDGNRNLIAAAKAHGVEHFILISVVQAAVDHPIELFRMKFAAEQELRASGLPWTIVRPTAYMETWVGLLGRPLLQTGKTRIFGSGRNPINFVSARDVAGIVDIAVADAGMRGEVVEIGGPEDLTFDQLVARFEATTGRTGVKSHIPVAMMRAMALIMRVANPVMAGQIRAGIVMDSRDMRFRAPPVSQRFPSLAQTSIEEMVRRDYPRR
jgi:uncharacterized protein YbjT (DUF2867 family)